jgi:hypothetical protein
MEMENETGSIRPWLLISLIVTVIVGAVFFTWYFWSQSNNGGLWVKPTLSDNNGFYHPVSPTPSPTTAVSPVSTADWKTYENDRYGFSMKFPSSWGEVKIKEFNMTGSDMIYIISVPSKNVEAATATIMTDAGYAPVFSIIICTLDQWVTVQDNGPIYAKVMAKNDKYVFAWYQATSLPSDFKNGNDIPAVIASFKLK